MLGALRKVAHRVLGATTTPRENVVAVGTTSVPIRAPNPNAVRTRIVNAGTTVVTLSFDSPVVSLQGFVLANQGDVLDLRASLDGDVCGAAIYAISAATGGSVFVLESVQEYEERDDED